MAKQIKNKKPITQANKADTKRLRYLIAIPVIALVIKLITMGNAQGGGWLGADGENYLTGVDGLLNQGFFSSEGKLTYWPAGYPILIWMLTKVSLVNLGWLISLTQSFFYAYSSYYFTKQLSQTKLRNFVIPVAIVIAINPTLSLSSMSVGYESPIASCMMMIIGLILKSKLTTSGSGFKRIVVGVGFFSALATFMQPRWILTTVVIAAIWALTTTGRKQQALILVAVIGVMAVAPLALVQRNSVAFQKNIVSTNLGITMSIGAGPETSGGYNHVGPNVPCAANAPESKVSDSELTKCVLKWYLQNPTDTLRLSANKSFFFWSPWVGPMANGTMARNPWQKINPIVTAGSTSKAANDLINGNFGKAASVVWVLGGILLMVAGFIWLFSSRGLLRDLGILALAPVAISFLVSLGTIGDHRFRLPTMPLSLFLQVLGAVALYRRFKTGSFSSTLETNAQPR